MAEVKHTLFACVTCDPREGVADEDTQGQQLYSALKKAVMADAALCGETDVEPARCMGNCKQPCTVAFAAPGKTTLVFVAQDMKTLPDVLETMKLYIQRPLGQILKEERAAALRSTLYCKIPPLK